MVRWLGYVPILLAEHISIELLFMAALNFKFTVELSRVL